MDRPRIICLTPVKNEAWILDKFLAATSLWADHIVIADQNSTDGSAEIANKFSKVIYIKNTNENFNEPERQKLLINEARKIEGPRLLITLDADEFFTSNYHETSEWTRMLNAKPGSYFGFRWINLYPGFKKAWYSDGYFPWAYMDDGREHKGSFIHSPRLPITESDEVIPLDDINVLHYQYADWNRMQSKQKYYQCLERVNFPKKNDVEIFRRYHHMYAVTKESIVPTQKKWFDFYEQAGINIKDINLVNSYWFDEETVKMFRKYDVGYFRQLNIWRKWKKYFKPYDRDNMIYNPANIKDKIIIFWLLKTQKHTKYRIVIYIDRIIKFKFWKLPKASC